MRLIVRGSQALQHGIGLLTGERRLGALQSVCDTIGQIEIAADINKRQAVARLLCSNAPGPERQTLRALYERLEDITDRYEDAIDALLDVASLGDPGTAGSNNSTQAAYALPAQGTDVTATPTMELDGCSTFCIDNSQLDIDNRSIAMVHLF